MFIKQQVKRLLQEIEYSVLVKYPKNKPGKSKIILRNTVFSDASSFLEGYKEIFKSQVYRFNTSTKEPRIIDCGANIGLATIYFKMLFPASKVTAIEADPNIFAILNKNIKHHNLKNVELINRAVWYENYKKLNFIQQGGYSGRVPLSEKNSECTITVETIDIRNYLDDYVDFLKMDIEGAENEIVLKLHDKVKNVKHFFLEYHSFLNTKQQLGEILTFLTKQGFRYTLSGAVDLASPFVWKNHIHDMDTQVNIFAINERI